MAVTGKRNKGRSKRGTLQKAKAEVARRAGSASAERDTAADRDTGRPSATEELGLTSARAASAGNPVAQTQIMDHTNLLDDVVAKAGGREMVEPAEAAEDTEVAGEAGIADKTRLGLARTGQSPSESTDRKMRLALGAAAVLALLFLVLAVVGFSIASSRADRLEELEQDAARLREGIAPHAGGADVEKWKGIARKEEQARRSSQEKTARLEAALAEAKAESEGLRANTEVSSRERKALEEELFKALEGSEDAARNAERVNQLQTKLEEATLSLTKATKDLTPLQAEHSRTVDEKARLEEVVGRMEQGKVLPEDQAEQEFRASIETAAAADDPDRRIELFRELTFALAGTKYGPPAARLWNREKKLKQADIDRAAARVYRKAVRGIRSTPRAHEENVETLKSALSGVEGSKYEKTIRELIEREEAKTSR